MKGTLSCVLFGHVFWSWTNTDENGIFWSERRFGTTSNFCEKCGLSKQELGITSEHSGA